MILEFESPEITLQNAGGKALNLSRLARAGFNVPPGLILSTMAYHSFVIQNRLSESINAGLQGLAFDRPEKLELVSRRIRSAFGAADLPHEIKRQIVEIHQHLDAASLAVRSSATAEDLPGLSFAGQQDTFLNIKELSGLIAAVVDCWSSLWTARAIGYRARYDIPHEEVAIAVIIQEMVPSDVSGVLFTANPLSGHRGEFVIDATFGLGEALVAGQVDPDHFVVDQRTDQVILRSIGSKQFSVRGTSDGGVESYTPDDAEKPSLSDGQIAQLVQLGRHIDQEFETPQDIEWAFAAGELHVLQSRPITSLYPLPELSYDPLIVWISFGSVQGLLGPMTPLGRAAVRNVLAGAGHLFGMETDPEEITIFVSAGQRIWIRISDFLRHPLGYRLFARLMRYVEPSVVRLLEPLMDETALGAGKGRLKLSTLRRAAGFFGPALLKALRNARNPGQARARFDREVDAFIASIELPEADNRFEFLSSTLSLMRSKIQSVFEFVLPNFIPIMGPGMASLVMLTHLAGERSDLALKITRGLPNNVTTQMDLALWEVALSIKNDETSLSLFELHTADWLAERYSQGKLPTAAAEALNDFLTRYGMRGVGEIDLGRPRWREDTTPVFQTLLSYLRVPPDSAPDVVFQRGEQAARMAVRELAQKVRSERFGLLKEKFVHTAARRARLFLGARETPKFMAIRAMGIIREALLESGALFVEAGALETSEDLFFLRMEELQALSQGEDRNWNALIEERRQSFEREKRRSLVPRVLVSDGRAFFEGVGALTDSETALSGSPVSPGVVEGPVRVVHDPFKAQLDPGDILVCPGTDPAWTPLFLAAGGLITEVGGMMTHGSVVAREYGIPAVVGVHEATTRLSNGQRIRLDGSTGRISLLDRT